MALPWFDVVVRDFPAMRTCASRPGPGTSGPERPDGLVESAESASGSSQVRADRNSECPRGQ